jgi:hypothetical protein
MSTIRRCLLFLGTAAATGALSVQASTAFHAGEPLRAPTSEGSSFRGIACQDGGARDTAVTPAMQGGQRDPAPGARAHHCLVYDEAKKSVLLCGGSTAAGESSVFYDDIWSFDGAEWQRVGQLDRPHSGLRIVSWPEGGRLVAFGGYTQSGEVLGQLREYVGGAWRTIDPAGDKAATDGGFVLDRRRARCVLFGGHAKGRKRGTTWEWDGTAWHRFDGKGPEPRSMHGMVYDQRRGRVVLFGGQGSARLADTWEWDGRAWSESTGPGPSARHAVGMAYDAKRGRTVLFGGGGSDGPLADTWVFDGAKWSELKIPGPPARLMPAMAYDAARDCIVLFGGRRSWPDDLADTWIFDGEAWQEVGAPR